MHGRRIISFIKEKDSFLNKIVRIRKFVHRRSKSKINKLYPIKLQVELTNKCNFNCKTCARHWVKFPEGNMNSSLIQKVKNIIPKIDELVLFGYGESLLYPGFFDLLEYTLNLKKRVSFFTNGSLITEDVAKKLVQNKVTSITFSLDGATKETLELIRENADFDKIVAGIEFINKFKKEYNSEFPHLEMNFVLTKPNVKDLPELIRFSSKHGFRRVECSYLIILSEELRKYNPLEMDVKLFIDEASALAKEKNIIFDIPHVLGGELKCESPWNYSYIRWDGTVQACCFSDKLVMGDLNKQSFDEIWNNENYQKLRSSIKKENYPVDDCLTCIARLKNKKFDNLEDIYVKTRVRRKY